MVAEWHRQARVRLPNLQMHAIFHVIVENQLAMGWQPVVETEARLRDEGLSRHEAIHAIASVAATDLFQRLRLAAPVTEATDVNGPYLEALRRLTAADWRATASSPDEH